MTSAMAAAGPSGERRRRREHALAAILLAVFILVFLSTPISSYRTALYTPADVTQASSLTRVEPDHRASNPLLEGAAVEAEAWLLFDRSELAHGRLPLWNPYNGCGTPQLANYSSAVFSPFSLPFYVLSLKNALLAAAFLKLFCLGFFTYLFLREIELVFLAALTGAVAFTFAGYNILLLGYPHPAATVALPLGLYFAERIARRFERGPRNRRSRPSHDPDLRDRSLRNLTLWTPSLADVGALPFLGFGAALVVGLFAGQPVAFYFAVLTIALYVAVRLGLMWWRSRRDWATALSLCSLAGAFALVTALAVGIAAVQVLPFLEYLDMSSVLDRASRTPAPLALASWPLLFFPNLLGNPATSYHPSPSLPPPDFETANLVYSGGLVLFLASISLFFVNRNRFHAFFAALAFVWFFYAYDVVGAWKLFALVPSVGLAPVDRSQGVWEFSLACCAAFAVHHLVHVHVRVRSMLFASTFFAGGLMLAIFLFGAQHMAVQTFAESKALPGREAIYQYSTPHLLHVSSMFLPGVLALSVMLLAPQGRLRRIFTAVILVSVFLQTGYLFRNYNPTSAEQFVFPRTRAVSELAEAVGRDRVAVLGDDTLVPDSNIVYEIATPATSDGISIERYAQLYREIFGGGGRQPIVRGTVQGLELFGIDYVLSKGDWLAIDTPFPAIPDDPRAFYETDEILPGTDVVQSFTGLRDGLQSIRLFAGSLGHAAASTLHVALEDPRDGSTIAAHDFDGRTLSTDPTEKTSLVFTFPPVADARGRTFRLRASSPDAQPGTGLSLWCRSDWQRWVDLALWRAARAHSLIPAERSAAPHAELDRWRLTMGTEALTGGLFCDFSAGRDAFTDARSIGDQTLYKVDGSPSRFHIVSRAIPVDDDEQAFARVQAPDFDPKLAVVLDRRDAENAPAASAADEPSRVRVIEELPTRIRLKLEHSQPGWLVIARPWYPGWRAHVGGEVRDIVRANYAFSALRLAPGENEVELEYDPPSLHRGLWISGLASLSLALFLWLVAWRARAIQVGV